MFALFFTTYPTVYQVGLVTNACDFSQKYGGHFAMFHSRLSVFDSNDKQIMWLDRPVQGGKNHGDKCKLAGGFHEFYS